MKWPFRKGSMLILAIVGVAAVVIGFSAALFVRRLMASKPSSDLVGVSVEDDKASVEEEHVDSIELAQGGPRLPEAMTMPVNGVVVAEFGWRRDPVMDYWRFTDGIDISCLPGTQVRAALSGRVVSVERDERGILAIRLEHAGGVESFYENLGSAWVEEGDEVGQGASLGEVGVGFLSLEGESVVRFMIVDHGDFVDPGQCIGRRF
jgi:murein DD-endopeptidase MepM/ murein hydrolase activator NlpD